MKYKEGEMCVKSGQYALYNGRGQKINQVEIKKGEPFPPTISVTDYYKAK